MLLSTLIGLFKLIPCSKLEQLSYSPMGGLLGKCFDLLYYVNKGENLYRIHDILIKIDMGKAVKGLFRPMPMSLLNKKVFELLEPNDIVIDVSSWIGYYVLLRARKALKVLAIELSSDNAKRIRENAALNQFQNVEVLNRAAGASTVYGR